MKHSQKAIYNQLGRGLLVILILLSTLMILPVHAREFGAYSIEVAPADVFPGADRFGPWEGEPTHVVAYKEEKPIGYVFKTNDVGYSGKPIIVVVGVTLDGKITGAKVAHHSEPILLVGIPEQKLFDFVNHYTGRNLVEENRVATGKMTVDAISGATVTAIVIHDGMTQASVRTIEGKAKEEEAPKFRLKEPPFQPASWEELLGEGAVRRLYLQQKDVDVAFTKMGIGSGEPYLKPGPPESVFIDMYATLITPEVMGLNILGPDEYANLQRWMAPSKQALLIMANGSYSFRGSGFVRGAIFDRFKLVQDGASFLFRDSHYHRLGVLNKGMPEFTEVGLFKIPESASFDPVHPWRLELLVQRPIGPIEKAFTSFPLDYKLPERFLEPIIPPQEIVSTEKSQSKGTISPKLWERVWQGHRVNLVILAFFLSMLTLIFFFQDYFVKRPTLLTNLRRFFLFFSVIWLGGVTQAQLSVVNVFTFIHSLMTGFKWDFFLLEPMIFVLWCGTAAALLFWGRGVYCGWLCPFGALSELLNWLARLVHIPQVKIPFSWHERLWAVKYILFLGLFGISLNSIAIAEWFAEIEPFKTVVLLRFQREWPYVVWALVILASGLVLERAFCRYLCPLGAALAIPGRLRIFSWLKRRRQCGELCSNCSNECLVQAILPNGEIHPNECFYCLRCQLNYNNEKVCPVLIMRRTRQERREAAAKS
ncbi:MAG: NosR/NirI family protein [Magnetococcus sp. DMHC-6]